MQSVRGRLNRVSNHLSVSAELGELPLGEAVVPAARRFAPELAPHLAKLRALLPETYGEGEGGARIDEDLRARSVTACR